MAKAHPRKSLVALGSLGVAAALSIAGCQKRAAGPVEAGPEQTGSLSVSLRGAA